MPSTRAAAPQARPAPMPPPPPDRPFQRVLLKLSGEAFCQPGGFGVDARELELIAAEVRDATQAGAELAVVVGGGNIIRGAQLAAAGHIHRATADYMGMLGTVINALALREKLGTMGIDSRVMSAIEIRAVAESFIRGRAIRHLQKGRVVILAAGTGNPFFSTDTCAALRATELECDVLLKATKVDGVYTADPRKDPSAKRYDHLTFAEAISKGLAVMDMTALTMCREHDIPVLVFDFKRTGNIRRVIEGESIGTRITQA
ncbi:MAG: UMP kinase [Phycisphaerales bacterium]